MKAARLLAVAAVLAALAIVTNSYLRREPAPALPLTSATAPSPAMTTPDPTPRPTPTAEREPPPRPDTAPAEVTRDVLRGTVREPDGTPVRAAHVKVCTERSDVSLPLGDPTIDADGRFSLDLSALGALSPAALATTALRVRVSAPIHRSAVAVLPAALPKKGAERRVDLVLEPGGVLRGRVVESSGDPVANANLEASPESAPGPSTSAASGDDGTFELPISGKGSHVLVARAGGVGTAVVRSLALDPAADTDLGDVTLRGPGAIEGFVRFKSGRPAPRIDVIAKRASSVVAGEAPPLEENGLHECRTASDANGRFRATGLSPGRFVLWAELGFGLDDDAPRVEAEVGDGDAVLVIEAHRLTMRVRSENGEPVPRAQYELRERKDDEELMSAAGRVDASRDFFVHAGSEVFARASAGKLEAEATRTIAEEDEDVVLDLVLAPPRERDKGRLRVEIVDANGERVPRFTATLRAVPSYSTEFFDKKPDEEGRLPLVSAGAYLLDVCPGRENFMRSFETYFPIENEPVQIAPGAETAVQLRARSGGRVQLTVTCATADVHPRVSVRRAAASTPVQLGLFAWSTADGASSSTAPRIGAPNVCAPVLEPGNWTLVVDADGFRTVEVPVAIDAGKLSDVSVELSPAH